MLLAEVLLASALRTGTVRLHVTDSHGRPLARRQVWLAPTNSTKPLRPFGVQWFVPTTPFTGVTDASGNVAIPKVPTGRPMMVVTRFGPRFDPFVGKDNPSGASLDVIKFDGAVYAGKKTHVVLADDRIVQGTVTDADGRPLKGVPVSLSDTGFGHMGGYPGTTLDRQTTGVQGRYAFTRLPNCSFLVSADAPDFTAVESRTDNGRWRVIAIIGQMESSQSVLTSKNKSACDFRISQTASLTVVFKGTREEFKGWTAWVSRGEVTATGQDLGYSPTSSTVRCRTLPGTVRITLTDDRGDVWLLAKELTLKPGETRTVELSMAEVLRAKRRRSSAN